MERALTRGWVTCCTSMWSRGMAGRPSAIMPARWRGTAAIDPSRPVAHLPAVAVCQPWMAQAAARGSCTYAEWHHPRVTQLLVVGRAMLRSWLSRRVIPQVGLPADPQVRSVHQHVCVVERRQVHPQVRSRHHLRSGTHQHSNTVERRRVHPQVGLPRPIPTRAPVLGCLTWPAWLSEGGGVWGEWSLVRGTAAGRGPQGETRQQVQRRLKAVQAVR